MKILLVMLFLFLQGCSSHEPQDDKPVLLPLPYQKTDPSDEKLLSFTKAYIAGQGAPANTRYEYTRVDLNGDNLREGLVIFKQPHSYWCGWAGCMMAIFEAGDNTFSLKSEITHIRGPLVITNWDTNGWKDLVARLSGSNMSDRNVLLRYEVDNYPSNPLNLNTLERSLDTIPGRRIFP